MGRWSDRLRDLRRRIEELAQDLAGALAPTEPEPVLVPVPVRARPHRGPLPPERG